VPETSLRSTDSSASSSPVTPPSLGSSPCFFGANGPSRFRVSVVESAGAGRPSPKSVVTSSSSSITIGFNVKVQAIDDPDSTTKANTTTQAASENTSVETFSIVPLIRETSHDEDIKNEDRYEEIIEKKEIRSDKPEVETWCEIDNIVVTMRNDDEMVFEQLTQNDMTQSQFERESIATTQVDSYDEVKDQSNVTMGLESTTITSENIEAIGDHGIVYTSTKELQVPAYPNEDAVLARISVIEDKALNSVIKLSLDDTSESCMDEASKKLSACVPAISSVSTASKTSSAHTMESHSQEQLNTSVQKHKSSLEKLLSLFQHPGQFFSDSATTAADMKNSLQENVSSVMALGDKMQQYLKESRAKINTDNSCSLEDGSPSRNRSVKNVTQLQNLTSIFTSFKLEPHMSLVEHGAKFFGQTKSQDIDIREKDSEKSSDIEIVKSNEKNSFHQEIPKNEEDLLDQERKQFMRNDDGNLVDQGKNQITRNGLSNLFDQWQNQITKNDEKNLIEKDQINRNDEKNLLYQEKNQTARDDEQKFDQIIKNDDKHSFDQMKDEIARIDEKNFENQREIEKKRMQIVGNANENFQIREKNQGIADLQDQQKNKIVNNNEYNLSNQGKVFMRNSEDLENMKGERIVINDKKDSTDIQNTYVDEKGDMCSVHKLQWSKIDFNDRPLPESVQSKNDFADNLIFDSDCVTVTNAVLSSLTRESMCVTAKLTDRAEYPVLQLSQTDGTGCNNAKCFDGLNDDSSREEYNDAQDLQSIEHNDAERIKCDEAEILENNDAGYLERKDTDKAANASIAMRTCDTTTTDSINQTSDSSFPICNIVHDRKTVDSVSIASEIESTMPNNVDGTLSMLNNDRVSLTSTDIPGESTIMSKNVDDEVTNDAYCITDQDRQRDFRRGNKEDPAEVVDITCRDYAHRRSTSVNIKIESRVSETTRPALESQMVSEEHRERQSFMPNAEIHRIIPKYAADTENHISEDAVNDSKRIDPTILVTPYEIPVSLDKSDAEELIFCMTDISFTDSTSVEDDLSSCVMPKDSPNEIKIIKVTEPFFELPVSGTVPMTTLLIGNSEIMHRNSQDSGIEETVLAIDDAVETMDTHSAPPPPTRSSLQESVDSGIESECSSICNKIESVISERALEATAILKKPRNHNGTHERNDSNVGDEDDDEDDEDDENDNGNDNNSNEFAKFTSDFLAKETRLIDNDSMSGIAHSYLSNIKCAVVSTAHPVAGMTTSNAPMEVVVNPDEGVIRPTVPVIAHSSTILHGTR